MEEGTSMPQVLRVLHVQIQETTTIVAGKTDGIEKKAKVTVTSPLEHPIKITFVSEQGENWSYDFVRGTANVTFDQVPVSLEVGGNSIVCQCSRLTAKFHVWFHLVTSCDKNFACIWKLVKA